MALGQSTTAASPSVTSAAPDNVAMSVEQKAREEAQSAQRDATIPRFNDVSCDVEYGFLNFKHKLGSKFSGFNVAARARYEWSPNDDMSAGVRVHNEYTKYAWINDTTKATFPGSDFLLLGGFYRRAILPNVDVGGQTNVSLFFRTLQRWDATAKKMVDSAAKTDWALNPACYAVYRYSLDPAVSWAGPLTGYAGLFAGYTYSSFSFSANQVPYAAIASIGTTFGRCVAAQADMALSHQFLIIGAQAPIYLSRLVSIMPGIKYPLLFQAMHLHNMRITVGVSSRF
jgi:hypothetical protein